MSPRSRFFAAAALYLLLPGDPAMWLRGVPLGLLPLAALAVLAGMWWFLKDAGRVPVRWSGLTGTVAVLAVIKVALWATAPPIGWQASYYANAEFSGPPRRSTEFTRLDATRIDRAIDFRDDYLPVYFLNEAGFNRGIRREVTEPLSIRWSGHVARDVRTLVPLSLEVKGRASVAIDGRVQLAASTGARAARGIDLEPGDHEIRVDYVKPADTDPFVVLGGFDADASRGGPIVTAVAVAPWRRAFAGVRSVTARAADFLVVLIMLSVTVVGVARVARDARHSLARALALAMFVLFVVQGVQAAAPLQHRALSLSGGDDWLAYEARAREVETGGLLMPFGKPLFTGDAFYYYPGYSYFLAAVHKVTGEDLSGPIFVHFFLLFLTNVIVYRIGRRLFDERVAIGSVLLVIAIEELAFIRHYTVILLSENLYVATVAWTVAALVTFIDTGKRSQVVSAGIAAGISSLVRPVMMLYFLPAIVIVLLATRRHRTDGWTAVRAALLFVACWLAVASLATLRNYLVAGQPIFIVVSPAHQFILDNLPANGQAYMRLYTGGLGSAVHVLARIAVEHPYELLRGVLIKVGFSLGWLQLMGGNAHPELLAASLGYLTALVAVPAARSFATWPIHAFVVTHLAGMVLRMPTLYGYRLILPLYLFFPMFATAALAEAARRVSAVRWARAT